MRAAAQGVTNFTDLSYQEFAKQYLMAPQAVPSQLRKKQRRRRGRCALLRHKCPYYAKLLVAQQAVPSQLHKKQRRRGMALGVAFSTLQLGKSKSLQITPTAAQAACLPPARLHPASNVQVQLDMPATLPNRC